MSMEAHDKECGDLNKLVPLFIAAPPERKKAAFAALAGEDDRSAGKRPASLRLFKMGDAAKAIGVSRATLWRLLQEGRIKAIEVRRGSLRVPETELQRFVAVA